jgi:hypothetical protein
MTTTAKPPLFWLTMGPIFVLLMSWLALDAALHQHWVWVVIPGAVGLIWIWLSVRIIHAWWVFDRKAKPDTNFEVDPNGNNVF